MSRRRLTAVPDRPQRVVLYVRVSAVMGRGGDEFHSPEVQVGAMRRVTAGMHEVDLIDDDIDQTGRTFSRAGIEKIRKLAEAGAIDAVAVYNISRFGRNVLESLQFLSWLAERGVTILSASEHIDTSTPSGRWMLTNMLAIAEMRSDEIGNEWSNTIHHRAQAGKGHGTPPTGYVRGEAGKFEAHPVAGPAMSQAFADYAADVPNRQVRRALRAATGLRMSGSALRGMLRNRTYLGEVRVGQTVTAGAHPALVDEETWEKAQHRLRRDARTPPRLAEVQYPLSGLTRCGVCDGSGNHRINVGTVRVFCRRQVDEQGCTGFGTPDAIKIEDAVLEKIRTYIAELRGGVGAASAVRARARRSGAEAKAVSAALTRTRTALVRAADGWSRSLIDDATYARTRAQLLEEETALQMQLDGLEATASPPEPGVIVALGDRLLKLWTRPGITAEQKNRALKTLVRYVVVLPIPRYSRAPAKERIRVEWK